MNSSTRNSNSAHNSIGPTIENVLRVSSAAGMELMKEPTSSLLAIVSGAVVYTVAAAAGSQILHSITPTLSTTWGRPITASVIFVVQLLPGFVVGAMHRQRVLLLGFVAGFLGGLTQGTVGIITSISKAGTAAEFPFGAAALDIILSAIPVGILGAAGAAVALVAVRGGNALSR